VYPSNRLSDQRNQRSNRSVRRYLTLLFLLLLPALAVIGIPNRSLRESSAAYDPQHVMSNAEPNLTLTVDPRASGTDCAGDSAFFGTGADLSAGPSTLSYALTDFNKRPVAIGDFNNDGKQDIASVSYGAYNSFSVVSINLGDGSGGFIYTPGTTVSPALISMAVGDFNNDGNQDLAITEAGEFGKVSIRLGNGAGSFTSAPDIKMGDRGSMIFSLAIGDFNNDGRQDLAVSDYLWGIAILLGNGAGSFTSAPYVPLTIALRGYPDPSIAIGDFNNDGNQDFAVAQQNSSTVSIRLGNGLGGFAAKPDVSVGSALSVAIGDFNNDGKQDIATANGSQNTVSIRLGDGAGGFTLQPDINVYTFPSEVAIGDFNNDGNQDFATANATSATISVRLGNGLGGFSGPTELSAASGASSLAIGDFKQRWQAGSRRFNC
jgi:hypothetical protein